MLVGCAGRAALHQVVLDYDETVSRAQAEMLLLNVARARHGRPLHFTAVSGIAATFDYRADASLGGEIAEDAGISILTPSLGVGIAENPTINIVPIQGEEFTRRLLAPLDESVLGFFYHQGFDAALLLRLLAHAVILDRDGRRDVLLNDRRGGAAAGFESVIDRIATLGLAQGLDAGPLVFTQEWPVPRGGAPTASDLVELLDAGYEFQERQGGGVLARRVVGRQVIADYDLTRLSNAEREELHRRAQEYPSYFVLLDLRGEGSPETRFSGWIKLRSLSAVIDAVAATVGRSETDSGDPPLRVNESSEPPAGCLFGVPYEGMHYWVPRDSSASSAAFGVLYRVHQMMVGEVPGTAVPPVTIAK